MSRVGTERWEAAVRLRTRTGFDLPTDMLDETLMERIQEVAERFRGSKGDVISKIDVEHVGTSEFTVVIYMTTQDYATADHVVDDLAEFLPEQLLSADEPPVGVEARETELVPA